MSQTFCTECEIHQDKEQKKPTDKFGLDSFIPKEFYSDYIGIPIGWRTVNDFGENWLKDAEWLRSVRCIEKIADNLVMVTFNNSVNNSYPQALYKI